MINPYIASTTFTYSLKADTDTYKKMNKGIKLLGLHDPEQKFTLPSCTSSYV